MKTRITPPPPPGWASWEDIMHVALAEADKAALTGEVPVGAVVVDNRGNIAGTGHNACLAGNDPTAHAEVLALRSAAAATGNYRLNGCCLVVTLEPCLMCAGAMVHARIDGVVYGAPDMKSGAVSSCLDGLDQPFHNYAVWHMGGILEEQCLNRLQIFFAAKRQL